MHKYTTWLQWLLLSGLTLIVLGGCGRAQEVWLSKAQSLGVKPTVGEGDVYHENKSLETQLKLHALIERMIRIEENPSTQKQIAYLKEMVPADWPDTTKLTWCKFKLKSLPELPLGAWLVMGPEDDQFHLLTMDFEEVTINPKDVLSYEREEHVLDDLRILCNTCISDERASRENLDWEPSYRWHFARSRRPSNPGYFYYAQHIRYAYLAMQYDQKELASELLSNLASEPRRLPMTYHMQVWNELRPLMLAYQKGNPRQEFIDGLVEIQNRYPRSSFEDKIAEWLKGFERDDRKRSKAGSSLDSPTSELKKIQLYIHQLCDVSGYQMCDPGQPVFSKHVYGLDPMLELQRMGPKVIPYLIKALNDGTPTRAIGWHRSFSSSYYFLRRGDAALKLIEDISGCKFYYPFTTSSSFYREDKKERYALVAAIKEWYEASGGRNFDPIKAKKIQIGNWDNGETYAYQAWGNMLSRLSHEDSSAETTLFIEEFLAKTVYRNRALQDQKITNIDQRAEYHRALERYMHKKEQRGDERVLCRHGGVGFYAMLLEDYKKGRLFAGEDRVHGNLLYHAAEHGGKWSLGLLAHRLQDENITDFNKLHMNAEYALEKIEKVAGVDFSYDDEGTIEERKAALTRAREWWEQKGRAIHEQAMQKSMPAGRKRSDVLLSGEAYAELIESLRSADEETRWEALQTIDEAYGRELQLALIEYLNQAKADKVKIHILNCLKLSSRLWHLPSYERIYRDVDNALEVRLVAAQSIQYLLRHISRFSPEKRLNVIKYAMDLSEDVDAPEELRQASIRLVIRGNLRSYDDRIIALMDDPVFADLEDYQHHAKWKKNNRENMKKQRAGVEQF